MPTVEFIPMSLTTEPGSKVRYLGVNGYDSDRARADKHLKIGGVYTVEDIDVGDWSSVVALSEVPNTVFNTVMFENA